MEKATIGDAAVVLSIRLAGTWNISTAADEVLLDFDRRFRRRLRLRTESGHDLMLDLPQAARLHQDDGLVLPDGGIVRVCARPEALLEIEAENLARIAWHLGNRHLPVQFAEDRLRIRADHVIAAMLEGLGATVRPIEASFDPEAGAYAAGGQHHHHDDDGHHHE